jgi:hypothetical protein
MFISARLWTLKRKAAIDTHLLDSPLGTVSQILYHTYRIAHGVLSLGVVIVSDVYIEKAAPEGYRRIETLYTGRYTIELDKFMTLTNSKAHGPRSLILCASG